MINENDVVVSLLVTFTAVIRMLLWLVVEVEVVVVADERIDFISTPACSCRYSKLFEIPWYILFKSDGRRPGSSPFTCSSE